MPRPSSPELGGTGRNDGKTYLEADFMPVNVMDGAYGVAGDGVTDDTTGFQAALTAAAGRQLYIPPGTYLLTAGFTISTNGTYIFGGGKLNTLLVFRPTVAGDILFKYTAGASIIYFCGLRGLTITNVRAFNPDDYTSAAKTAVQLNDVSEFSLADFSVSFFTSTAYDSIGLHIKGREFINLVDVDIQADRPYVFDTNPNGSYLVADACTWTGVYGRSAYHSGPVYSPSPVVEAINKGHIQHWTVNGFVMSGMHGGFYFNPANLAASCSAWNITGMHYEMPLASGTGAYGIKIQQGGTPQSIFGVTITGYTSGSSNYSYGILGRDITGLKIADSLYDGTITGLDINESCNLVKLQNFLMPQAAATISYGALVQTGPSRKGPYTTFAVAEYVTAASDYKDFYSVQFTHDISVAGTQALTGFGFRPRMVTVTTVISGVANSYSIGSAGDGINQSLTGFDIAGTAVVSANLVYIESSAGNHSVASFTSSDADGMTITWTKTGAPVGTATCTVTAWR